MAYPEYYRELIDNAREAVEALLKAGAVDSWILLRSGYGEIRRAQEYDDGLIERLRKRTEQETQGGRRVREDPELLAARERQAAWRRSPKERREGLVLQVLGDERLTISELTERLEAKLNPEREKYGTVYDSAVRALAMQMLAAGQLEREGEEFRGRLRYRFFRKAGLSGPIADLERVYNDDGETS